MGGVEEVFGLCKARGRYRQVGRIEGEIGGERVQTALKACIQLDVQFISQEE